MRGLPGPGWRIAASGDLRAYLAFLEARERSCVALADRSLRAGARGYAFRDRARLLLHVDAASGNFDAAVFSGDKGDIHCIISAETYTAADGDDDGVLRGFAAKFRGRAPGGDFSVAGPGDSVVRFERAARFEAGESNPYTLMFRPRMGQPGGRGASAAYAAYAATVPPSGVAIREARASDFHALCDLQSAYEAEEVYSGVRPSGSYIAMRVSSILRGGSCLVAEFGGRLVGKANLNARGIRCDQVGGVFVTPALRSRGICAALVGAIAARSDIEGRDLALYVKPGNQAARRAYLRCAFAVTGVYLRDECRRAGQGGS